jgi:two-component system, chemotaxis family, protein-glutamate methylesterase/glutaminase
MHIGSRPSKLPELLSSSEHPASFARNGALIRTGHIYVAPPDHHMVLGDNNCIRLNQGPKVHYTRPAADPLFISAAEAHGRRVMGIVLSGGDGDGAAGLRAIGEHGGTAFVQDPDEAEAPSMPRSAILADHPDACLAVEEIAQRVRLFSSRRLVV